MYSYTLKELASFFEIPLAVSRSPQEREALGEARKKCGDKRKGWKAAALNGLAAFATLKDFRGGGFDEGHRHHAAMIYATQLCKNGVTRDDAGKALVEMAQQCAPSSL